jgi:hypothetical protein
MAGPTNGHGATAEVSADPRRGDVAVTLERFADTLQSIDRRLSRIEAGRPADGVERVEALLALADQVPALIGTMTDTFDSVVGRLRDAGIDVDDRARRLLLVADRLTRPETLTAVEAMLDSGLFDPGTVAVVGHLGNALAQTGAEAPERVGVFGALRALRDPDVQRAVGFLVAIARRVGSALPAQAALPPADQ